MTSMGFTATILSHEFSWARFMGDIALPSTNSSLSLTTFVCGEIFMVSSWKLLILFIFITVFPKP